MACLSAGHTTLSLVVKQGCGEEFESLRIFLIEIIKVDYPTFDFGG